MRSWALYNRPHDDWLTSVESGKLQKIRLRTILILKPVMERRFAEQNAWEGRIGTGLTDYDPTALPAPPPPSTTTPPAPTRTQPAPPPSRGYSCGGSSGLTGSCTECEKKKLMGQPLQTKLLINESGDVYEQEADRVAVRVMRSDGNRFET